MRAIIYSGTSALISASRKSIELFLILVAVLPALPSVAGNEPGGGETERWLVACPLMWPFTQNQGFAGLLLVSWQPPLGIEIGKSIKHASCYCTFLSYRIVPVTVPI